MQQALLDLFVGDALSYREPTRTQTVRAVMLGLSLLVWIPVFIPAYALAGAWWSTGIFLVSGTLSLLGLFAFRWHVVPRVVNWGLMVLFWGTLVAVAFVSGGIQAPALLWLPAVPIVAVLLMGRAAGLIWLIISCGTAIGFFLADQSGLPIRQELPGAILLWLHVASLCGIVICATMLTTLAEQSETEIQDRLKEALHRADAGSRAKSEFLAKMGHELRTPINGVIGMTELALATDLTPHQRMYLQTAKHSAEGLAQIVNNVLNVAQVAAAPVTLHLMTFHVREFVKRTTESHSSRVDSTKLSVSTTIASGVPEMVVGDRDRLQQVMSNLVDNAIKFTEQREVIVSVDVTSRKRDELELRFVVSDTGIGIADHQQSRMFEEFAQADDSSSRSYGGAGLGLTIARSLVTQLGGRIWLESAQGRGTKVTFTVPVTLERTEGRPRAGSDAQPIALLPRLRPGLRVLVVDDNKVNQILMRGLLEKQGCHVTSATNGADAVTQTRAGAFDVVLMDIEMPGMDGFETTARIRMREAGSQLRVPIVAFTANVIAGYERRCLEADMNGYLAKPIQISDLVHLLARCGLSEKAASPSPE